MRVYQKVLSFMALVILFSHKIQASTCDSISPKLMEQTWQEFRAIHPFGFQTVGLKHFGDTCVFVMSEPNNWVNENDLRQLFDKYDGQLTTRYQLYGIDGQLIDAIGCAKLDSIQFLQLEKELFNLLYRTGYKPYYTDLDHPVEHIYFSEVPLNYSISWERLKSIRFLVQFPNDSISEKDILGLCSYKMSVKNDVFYSKHRGLIAWVIGDIKDYLYDPVFLANARRFALDSDLILGTYHSTNDRIVIIGREREVPVTILPPLRSETILSLASTKENISLVFNKDSVNVINDTLKATPIKMSSMLNDTELGNLMVMTDIFLKSWSENGKVKEYTINHPLPNSYPFPHGVAHELGDSTTFLWNIENVEMERSGFYPIVRTGCLSPTYWSANDNLKMKQNVMNNIAYDYFARLNCPDLVRVVMYNALYRIFHGYGVKHDFKRENPWVKTPSFTISNNSWAYGGYQGWLRIAGRGSKSTAVLSRHTASQLQKITGTLDAFLTHYHIQALNQGQIYAYTIPERQIINQGQTHAFTIPNRQIRQTLNKTEKLLEIASSRENIMFHSESREIRTTLKQYIDALTILSSNCTDPIIKARINTRLSKAYELSKKYGLDGSFEPISIIIHSVVPKDTPRGLNFDEHVKPTSSSHILTVDEVKEKVQEYQQHQNEIYKLKIRFEKTGFVYIKYSKYDKDFQLSA